MITAIILISLGAIALTLFLIEKVRRYSLKATIIKSIASLLFIALAAYCFFSSGLHTIGIYVIIALVFGLLGDIWLDLKYVFKEEDRTFTYAGFAVFAIGHVLYITGMFLEFFHDASPLYIIFPMLGGLLGGTLVLIMEKPMKLEYKEMRWVCFAYGCLLFANPCTSLSLLILNGWDTKALLFLFIGGIFFVISDLILSGTYFGKGKERPVDIISNAVTYYAAQYLIAFSLFFL